MKLLIVGDNGRLGAQLRPALEAHHTCYYLAAEPVPGAEDRTFTGDLSDEKLIGKAGHGIDRVVWLRANKESFPADIKALYRLLHIAQFSGVLRFIYASSMSVYANSAGRSTYPIHELVPTDAWENSGLGHRLAEAIGQACVRNRPECTFIALRLMEPHINGGADAGVAASEPRYFPLLPNDLCRLMLAAISFDRLGYYVLQATGDLEGTTFPNTRATAVLDWQPQGN